MVVFVTYSKDAFYRNTTKILQKYSKNFQEMRQTIISALLLLSANISIGQIQSNPIDMNSKEMENEVFMTRLSQQFHYMKLNLTSYSREEIGNINHELNTYKEKVTSIIYDDINKTMDITHNGLIKREDIYEVVLKHISKNHIISYQ